MTHTSTIHNMLAYLLEQATNEQKLSFFETLLEDNRTGFGKADYSFTVTKIDAMKETFKFNYE